MKKGIALFLVLLLALAGLTACSKKPEAVKNVEGLIKALDGSEEAASAARDAYNALPSAEKEQVKNLEKLEEAEQRISDIHSLQENLNDILDAANADFSGNGMEISGAIEKAQEVLNTYDSLSKEEKERYGIDVEGLEDALATLGAYADDAEKGAAAYVKAFLTVYPGKEVVGVYCLKQIRPEANYHFYALTYKDGDAEATVYANARCTAEVKAEAIAERADVFFAAAPATSDYDAKENGNVTLDLARVLELAQ